ncbi:MAG: peptidylprolyl isomerase [Pseudomonadales bacterium]
MNKMMITGDSTVSLRFSLSLENGQLVDGNIDGDTATFIMGDGTLLPGFEQFLVGLEVGADETFEVTPEYAFGMPNPSNIQEFSRSQFAGIVLEPGVVLSFADASQSELPGVVKTLEGDTVIVDFNHPLAGKTLKFSVIIEGIQ